MDNDEECDDDGRNGGAVDASGTFTAVLEEPRKEERVIALPEVYLRMREENEQFQAQNVKAAPVVKGKKKAEEGTPQYVPGLQFVGKSIAKKQAEKVGSDEYVPPAPLLLLNQLPGLAEIRDDSEKFKRDVELRPQEADLAAYDDMPVEEFGKALLRGMGWKEGGAVGKSNAAVVEPIQYIPRPEGLGLGADVPAALPEPPDQKRRKILRPGEEEKSARDKQYVMPVTEDGKVRHYQTGSGPLVEKKSLAMKTGAHVAVAHGVHSGLVGTVVSILGSGIMVKLKNSDAVVATKKDDVILFDPALLRTQSGADQIKGMIAAAKRRAETDAPVAAATAPSSRAGGAPPAPASSESNSAQDSDSDDDAEGKSSKSKGKSKKKNKKKSKKEKKTSSKKRTNQHLSWLTPGIVVRCISKTFHGGSLYGKKLVVVDLTDVDCASMVLLEDRHKVIENVRESLVETVVPPCGGSVHIVRGERAGETGVVREKNSDKNRALVEMIDDGSIIVTLAMDDIAQYVGMNE